MREPLPGTSGTQRVAHEKKRVRHDSVEQVRAIPSQNESTSTDDSINNSQRVVHVVQTGIAMVGGHHEDSLTEIKPDIFTTFLKETAVVEGANDMSENDGELTTTIKIEDERIAQVDGLDGPDSPLPINPIALRRDPNRIHGATAKIVMSPGICKDCDRDFHARPEIGSNIKEDRRSHQIYWLCDHCNARETRPPKYADVVLADIANVGTPDVAHNIEVRTIDPKFTVDLTRIVAMLEELTAYDGDKAVKPWLPKHAYNMSFSNERQDMKIVRPAATDFKIRLLKTFTSDEFAPQVEFPIKGGGDRERKLKGLVVVALLEHPKLSNMRYKGQQLYEVTPGYFRCLECDDVFAFNDASTYTVSTVYAEYHAYGHKMTGTTKMKYETSDLLSYKTRKDKKKKMLSELKSRLSVEDFARGQREAAQSLHRGRMLTQTDGAADTDGDEEDGLSEALNVSHTSSEESG